MVSWETWDNEWSCHFSHPIACQGLWLIFFWVTFWLIQFMLLMHSSIKGWGLIKVQLHTKSLHEMVSLSKCLLAVHNIVTFVVLWFQKNDMKQPCDWLTWRFALIRSRVLEVLVVFFWISPLICRNLPVVHKKFCKKSLISFETGSWH